MEEEYLKSDDKQNIVDNLFSVFRNKDQQAIAGLYIRYREPFFRFIFKKSFFSLDQNDAIHIYNESFMALHENVIKGKLKGLKGTFETYFFTIGRNKLYDYLGKKGIDYERFELTDDFSRSDSQIETDNKKQILEIAYELISRMKEPCKTVLTLFYEEGWKLKEMVGMANGLGTEKSVKTKRYDCMEVLKPMLYSKLRSEGLIEF